MKNKRVMKLASRGKRLGAYCIDIAIPAVSFVILMIASSMYAIRSGAFYNDPFNSYGYGYGNGFGYGYGYGYGGNGPYMSNTMSAVLGISILAVIALSIVQIAFYTKSKTIGKAALGLQVVSSKDGKPIGFWMMLLREWFVKRVSYSVFMLGFFWILIDDKNRTWHDKILDTYVIDQKESAKFNTAGNSPAATEQTESIEDDISGVEEMTETAVDTTEEGATVAHDNDENM